MPYKVSFHSQFERDVKAFKKNKPVKKLVFEQVQAVIENPGKGEPMVANMLGVYKVSFGERPQYRLLYRKYECCQKPGEEIECPVSDPDTPNDECKGVVTFIFVKTREECNNLYKKERVYFDGTTTEGLSPI
jgi:mRNA-degrading endonuclease RelE of RelBE toxin-antitoxin system